jgi:hypothetical protein
MANENRPRQQIQNAKVLLGVHANAHEQAWQAP